MIYGPVGDKALLDLFEKTKERLIGDGGVGREGAGERA